MRKDFQIVGYVTIAALIAATIGHAYCREFCIAFKPMAWPFIALGYVAIKRVFGEK